MKNPYKISYAFAGIYTVLALMNLVLAHWNLALADMLLVVLFLRVGTYEEAIAKGHLVRVEDLRSKFDYSK